MINIFSFCKTFVITVVSMSSLVIEFLSTEFSIPFLGSFTLFDMCFGAGIVVLLGFLVAKGLL